MDMSFKLYPDRTAGGSSTPVAKNGVKGSQVRIGVDAPKDVEVHREEVFAPIKHDRTSAGNL
jgi:carbon storage regulator